MKNIFRNIFNLGSFPKQNQKCKISILVPCYNTTKTLPRTLKSIQASYYENLDVMIVDDGSIQKADKIVADFHDNRFRYVWKENEGLGLTRNWGIEHALGEFIFFLDSDDEIYPDAIENLLNYALSNQLDVVSGVTVRKDFETKTENEWFRSLYKSKSINEKLQRMDLYSDTLSTNKLYRVQYLKENNILFEKGLYEDKLFTAKLYSKINRIGLIDNRVYIWWLYGANTSITNTKTVSNFKERQLTIEKLWQYIPNLRKVYQLTFYINHDLLIYLREFIFYSDEEKCEIYHIAHDFIQRNIQYVYKRSVSVSLNRACLDALCDSDMDKFIYTANILSQVYQNEQNKK